MTYSEAFSLWVAEVYRNHGYEPDKWYGSEVVETLYNEAIATYNGPPATMRDYIEAIPSAEEFAYLDYAIERLRRDNINLNALSDKERWALMDKIIAEYPQYKDARTSHPKRGCRCQALCGRQHNSLCLLLLRRLAHFHRAGRLRAAPAQGLSENE